MRIPITKATVVLTALTTAAVAADASAKVIYSRSTDFTYAVELKVGTPQQSLVAQLDTESRDIVLSSSFESESTLFGLEAFNFDYYSSSSFSSFSSSWGTDSISFADSLINYTDVLFGIRDDGALSSIFALGQPNTYADDKKNFWDVLSADNLKKTYALGFAEAPEDAPGVYSDSDASSADGVLVFGGVARSYYDSLTTIPLLLTSGEIAFTLTAVGIEIQGESSVQTVSTIRHYTAIQTRQRLPSMPAQLLENIVFTLGSDLTQDNSGLYLLDCDAEFELLLNFQGGVVRIPSAELLTENDDNTCSFAILPSESSSVVLGGGILSYLYFVVDFEENEISLGQASFPGSNEEPEIELIKDSIPGASKGQFYSDTYSSDVPEPTLAGGESSSESSSQGSMSTSSAAPASTYTTMSSSESSSIVSSAVGAPYLNTTSSSNAASSSSVICTDVPEISGQFIAGKLVWTVSVPSCLGPFTAFSYECSGKDFTVVSVMLNGKDLTTESSVNGAHFELDTSEVSAFSGDLSFVYSATRDDATSVLNSNGVLAITRPDVKRDVMIYELSYAIDTASAVVASVDTIVVPTSTSAVEIDSTTVITVTSCSNGMCSEAPVTTGLTLVTSTVESAATEYTTYCPLSGASSSIVSASSASSAAVSVVTPSMTSLVASTEQQTTGSASTTSSSSDSTITATVEVTSVITPAAASQSTVSEVTPTLMTFSGAAALTSVKSLLVLLPLLLL